MRYTFSVTKRQYARIPLILRTVGINHTQDPILRPKGFPIWQIFFGVSGSGEFFVDGARFILGPGQIALLPPHVRHGYRSLGGPWILHYVGFEGLLCPRLMVVLGLSEAGVFEPADSARFLVRLQGLEKLAVSRDTDAAGHSADLYALLLELSTGLRRLPDSHPFFRRQRMDHRRQRSDAKQQCRRSQTVFSDRSVHPLAPVFSHYYTLCVRCRK